MQGPAVHFVLCDALCVKPHAPHVRATRAGEQTRSKSARARARRARYRTRAGGRRLAQVRAPPNAHLGQRGQRLSPRNDANPPSAHARTRPGALHAAGGGRRCAALDPACAGRARGWQGGGWAGRAGIPRAARARAEKEHAGLREEGDDRTFGVAPLVRLLGSAEHRAVHGRAGQAQKQVHGHRAVPRLHRHDASRTRSGPPRSRVGPLATHDVGLSPTGRGGGGGGTAAAGADGYRAGGAVARTEFSCSPTGLACVDVSSRLAPDLLNRRGHGLLARVGLAAQLAAAKLHPATAQSLQGHHAGVAVHFAAPPLPRKSLAAGAGPRGLALQAKPLARKTMAEA